MSACYHFATKSCDVRAAINFPLANEPCNIKESWANFTSFPSNSLGKARAVFKLYFGVKSKLKKKDYTAIARAVRRCQRTRAPAERTTGQNNVA